MTASDPGQARHTGGESRSSCWRRRARQVQWVGFRPGVSGQETGRPEQSCLMAYASVNRLKDRATESGMAALDPPQEPFSSPRLAK